MSTVIKYFGVVAICLIVSACAPKARTVQEKIFDSVVENCTEQTNMMLSPDHAKGDSSWGSYFEWCMDKQGYTRADLKDLWY